MSQATRELDPSEWERFFTTASALLPASEVSIEVTSEGVRYVEAEAMAFESMIYDSRSDVFEISGARGGAHSRQVLRRFVSSPRRIAVDCRGSGPPGRIDVEGADGELTRVRLAAVSSISS